MDTQQIRSKQGEKPVLETMYFEIESYSHNEQLARVVTAAYMTRLNPTVEETEDVKTAVSEAVTNAIIHGYRESGEKIRIWVSSRGQELTVTVEDQGAGIVDVEQARQPLYTTSREGERSGMGFTFMETFMDSVEVESEPGKGTRVIMKKKIGTEDRVWTKQ